LRRDDALAMYDRKDDAEQEAARLNATIGRNPYRKAVKFPLVLCARAAISRFALCETGRVSAPHIVQRSERPRDPEDASVPASKKRPETRKRAKI
jgi:hypothetical protein